MYCDEFNEHSRQVVKSIIKAMMGDYELGIRESVEAEYDDIMGKYGENLLDAM